MNETPETDDFKKTWPDSRRHNWPCSFEADAFEKIAQLERERDHARALLAAESRDAVVIAEKLMQAEEERDQFASALSELQRDAFRSRIFDLEDAIHETILANLHLADGDDCTLKRLKDAIGFVLPAEDEPEPPTS